jgi:competence protein ComEC
VTDRAAVMTALAAASAALLAPPLPPAAALLFVAAWVLWRHPLPLAVALVVLVGGRAHGALAALESPVPERVEGVGELASDPEQHRFDTRFTVRVGGRRYLARVPSDRSSDLRRMLTGERVQLAGRTASLNGAPEGWVRSQHLAARLDVSAVAPAGSVHTWYRVANAIHRVLGAGAGSFGDGQRSLYLGLVIGDDRGQDDLTRFRFEASGLSHLLAVSGLNVS